MNEEILKILTMVKNSVMSEDDAAELLTAMYESDEQQTEEKQTVVIKNYLPWDDDGKLRIIAFKGHNRLNSSDAYRDYKFNVKIDEDVGDIAECCGNLYCGDVSGAVYCGGGFSGGDVGGTVSCGGGFSGGDVSGDVQCGGGVNCGDVSGSVKTAGKVTCSDVGGDVSADSVECGDVSGSVTYSQKVNATTSDGSKVKATINIDSDNIKKQVEEGMGVAKEQLKNAADVMRVAFSGLGEALRDIGKDFNGKATVVHNTKDENIEDNAEMVNFDNAEQKIDDAMKKAEELIKSAEEKINIKNSDTEKASEHIDYSAKYPSLPWGDDDVLRIAAFKGQTLLKNEQACSDYHFNVEYDGDACDIVCCGNLSCNNVDGDVSAGGSVKCDNIDGDASAGASITCDSINGDASAGSSLSCEHIEGDASAGTTITCDEIGGDASASTIECETIEGDASASTINMNN